MREHNPHALLRQASGIYGVYYDTGRREYERISDTKAVLRTHDSLSFSVADCATVVGWHVRAIEMCGGRNVRVVELLCRALGGPICEYLCEVGLITSRAPAGTASWRRGTPGPSLA